MTCPDLIFVYFVPSNGQLSLDENTAMPANQYDIVRLIQFKECPIVKSN